MTQFHEGQDVEVWCFPDGEWEKAKIVMETLPKTYQVQFPDGSRRVFDAEHIRDPKVGRAMYEHAARLVNEPTGTYETMARGPHAKVNGLEI